MTASITAQHPSSADLPKRTPSGVLGQRGLLVPLIPAITTLAVTMWGLASPSFWRDEAVTVEVARFSLRATFRTFAHVDVVHALYYLLIHAVVRTIGSGEIAVRFPSVVGAVAAAAATALIGRRLCGPKTGLAAGLFVALSPTISRFAAEARSYSIVTGLAAWATYLLIRAADRTRWRALAGYGSVLALLGLVHLFALLLLPAHAVAVWRTHDRTLMRRWLTVVGCAVLVITPLACLSAPQRSQLDWIAPLTARDVIVLISSFAGSALLVVPVCVLAVFGLIAAPPRRSRIDLRALTVVWIVVPPVVLMGVSLLHPYYVFRYVLLCVPAVALLAANGLTRLRLRYLIPSAIALALLSVPAHLSVRKQTSRMDDLRQAATILRTNKLPGDSIVFRHSGYRRTTAAYPEAFRHLRDLSLAASPEKSARLGGSETSLTHFTQRLGQTDRVWFVVNYVVPGNRGIDTTLDRAKSDLVQRSPDFQLLRSWHFHGGTLYLYRHIDNRSMCPPDTESVPCISHQLATDPRLSPPRRHGTPAQ